jgi:naphthalene 1,2-dioxygenase ferredoxin component
MNWTLALPFDDVFQGDVIPLVLAGRDLAIYGIDGAVHATDNTCTHGLARLCEGFLEGFEIECPMHQGRFDVRTGAPTCAPAAVPIRVYATKVEAGQVFIALD